MSGLRSLLRLDDKVAAEGRRLQQLGGPSLRWLAPLTLIAAVVLHGAILLLPAVRTEALPPPVSAAPGYPLVWRPLAPALRPPEPPPPMELPPAVGRTQPSAAAPTATGAGRGETVRSATRPMRAFTVEPVLEPTPTLALTRISADVEAIIPNPDQLPPAFEPGPPSATAAAANELMAAPIEQFPPAYPVAAKTLGAEGSVTLRAEVRPDGTVAGAVVISCTRRGLGFESAALAAVKRWRFSPAPLQSGSREVPVTVQFQRQKDHP